MIDIHHLKKTYEDGFSVLKDVNATIEETPKVLYKLLGSLQFKNFSSSVAIIP
jgi:hypothetical protein